MAIDWTSQRIKTLTKLWDEGHTTSEIGRRLGVTKNSVVGKAHRMSLPKRQSPIARKPSQSKPKAGAKTAPAAAAKPAAKPKAAAPKIPIEPEEPSIIKLENLQSGMCSWPFNEPGTPEFHFCGEKPTVPDKPYCLEHCMMAYVKSSKDKGRHKPVVTKPVPPTLPIK